MRDTDVAPKCVGNYQVDLEIKIQHILFIAFEVKLVIFFVFYIN